MSDLTIVPNDFNAEQAVLGQWLSDDSKRTSFLLHPVPPEAFYWEEHVLIASAIRKLAGESKPADPVTVAAELERVHKLDYCGGIAYLRKLVENTCTRENTAYYVANVRDMKRRRNVIEAARDAFDQGFNLALSTAEVRSTLSAALADEFEQKDRTFMDIAQEGMSQFEEQEKTRSSWATPRIEYISSILDAFRPGRVGIIAGLPGTGKSSIAAWWVLKNAMHGIPCAFISLEMDRLQIFNRLIAEETGLENEHIDRCQLTDPEQSLYAKAANGIAEYPIRIIDDCPATEDEVLGAIQRAAAIHGCRFIVVDYLQLVYAAGRGLSRNEELSRFTARLKTAARELNVYILEVSQLSRDSVKESRKPRLQDLRDSGGLEQNADDVLLLSETTDSTPEKANILCDVAKHRSGKRGVCVLTFDKQCQRWSSTGGAPALEEGKHGRA